MSSTLSTMTGYDTTEPADPVRAVVAAAIGDLTWTATTTDPDDTDGGHPAADGPGAPAGGTLVPVAGLHLAAALHPLHVARVDTGELPAGGTAAGRGLVGVEIADRTGRTRIYALHDDIEVLVVAAEYTPSP